MSKKIISLMLVSILVLTVLVGCGDKGKGVDTPKTEITDATETTDNQPDILF